MLKRIGSGIVLILLLIGMLTLMFNIQLAKASGTIYIRANGNVDPTTAPISTTDNITYTLTNNITDPIVIERSHITVVGNEYTVQGGGNGCGFNLTSVSNVTIKNTNVKGFHYGIYLQSSNYNSMSGNNITANDWYGVYLGSSSNNTLSLNNLTNNRHGIYLEWYSDNNSILSNNITNNMYTIQLWNSNYNRIIGNTMANSVYGGAELYFSPHTNVSRNTFVNDGLFVYSSSFGNTVEDNIVNGKPLVYLENMSNYAIGDSGQVVLVNCYNITVKNLNLLNTSPCIELWGTSNCKISRNSIMGNHYYGYTSDGIYLRWSCNNTISENNITNNRQGIRLESCSDNNTVHGNNITSNSDSGISSEGIANSSIHQNNIKMNFAGIELSWNSKYNNISFNDLTGNGRGIDFSAYSHNNTISGNRIIASGYGMTLSESTNNSIYHNSFEANTYQVYMIDDSMNIWDDGYPSGGNYWSDYTGVDYYHGSYQDELGNDGIGDTAYIVDANNVDNYPLMVPSGTTPYYDWPMFHRDPKHTGYSASTAPNTNHTIWSYTTGGGVLSSPTVVNNKLYIGSLDYNVYCLDALTGSKIWNYTTGNYVTSSPTIDDGKVYIGSYDHNIYCLNASTGTKIWNYTTGDCVAYSSPAVAYGKVYVGSVDRNV